MWVRDTRPIDFYSVNLAMSVPAHASIRHSSQSRTDRTRKLVPRKRWGEPELDLIRSRRLRICCLRPCSRKQAYPGSGCGGVEEQGRGDVNCLATRLPEMAEH